MNNTGVLNYNQSKIINKKTKQRVENHTTRNVYNVTSNNQSGGQTAANIRKYLESKNVRIDESSGMRLYEHEIKGVVLYVDKCEVVVGVGP